MKKFTFIFILFFSFIFCSGQILKPVTISDFKIKKSEVFNLKSFTLAPNPKSFLTLTLDTLKKSKWLIRLNVGILGLSYDVKDFKNPIPFDAILYGVGYLHYKLVNGVPFNDFGVNSGLVQSTQNSTLGIGVFGTYNTGLANNLGLLNAGTHYDFSFRKLFIDLGLTFHF
jgi:hypothetical protein